VTTEPPLGGGRGSSAVRCGWPSLPRGIRPGYTPGVPKLTVTVITRNESANLAPALDSVSWADEVIVVDSRSTDDTATIAERHGARVIVRDWPGYSAQKNFAAREAAHDWILSIDADERVTPALADEVRALMAAEPGARGYRIPRVSYYLGRWIRSTDWYPDYQLRLYDRRVSAWAGLVHEGVDVKGPIGRLHADLQHLPYRDMSHHLETIDRYTSLAARQMRERGQRVGVAGLLARPVGAFLRNYVIRSGWRDGSVGLVVSVLNSYYVFLKFAKLWETDRGSRP
jgi:glycosyltransferase involved in cell wall biosynthesis